ncbi:YdeI/OmpD-associated family protein [Hyphococcus sp.]|uniref:YdeI/OmpD-associated family protein n=1 Tax=Hyphococcus sp. TaxID=2038636 RepID=UPI003CCBBBA5
MTRKPEVEEAFKSAKKWRKEALRLRRILLDCGLNEELKWGKPCYSENGANICIVQRMNDFLALLFFKGALLPDPDGMLERQGPNSRSGFRMRFTNENDVMRREKTIRACVREAIKVEKAGLRVEKAAPPARPDELLTAFKEDPAFKTAFERLTPGRQRGYVLHFSNAKQSKTRGSRIAKHKPQILAGKGLHDR